MPFSLIIITYYYVNKLGLLHFLLRKVTHKCFSIPIG